MKYVVLTLSLLIALELSAQTDGLSYQAVIISDEPREIPGVDVQGGVLSEGEVELRFSIYNESEQLLFMETHLTATDRYGMVNVVIGMGQLSSQSPATWQQIHWDGSPRWLQVELRIGQGDFAEFSKQELLFVPYAYHREIYADRTLEVRGSSTLRDTLRVVDGSPSLLSGDLAVGGDSELAGQLAVGGSTDLQGSLQVAGTSGLNGQVTISAATTGAESAYAAYPLRVEGANQGIAIQTNGAESVTKNYLAFFNGSGSVVGRVEGQSLSELQNSFRFIWDVTMGGLEQAFIAAEGVACGSQIDLAEAGVMVANTAIMGAQWVELTANYEFNVGVAYESGGADYAEWLKLAEGASVPAPGEVVGLHAGKVSRDTRGAERVMVVSTNPAVVGNLPPDGSAEGMVRVAFLGQAPVRVVGPVRTGDLLLPSGYEDGTATAMPPAEVPTERLQQVVGVAWESATGVGLHLVNTGIGLQTLPLARRLANVEQRLNALEAAFTRRDNSAALPGPSNRAAPLAVAQVGGSGISAGVLAAAQGTEVPLEGEAWETWLRMAAPIFTQQMQRIKQSFLVHKLPYQQYPEVARIVDDPVEALRAMQQGKFMPALWSSLQERYVAVPPAGK